MIGDMQRLLKRLKQRYTGTGPEERVLTVTSAIKAMARAANKIGIPVLTHHDLRHFFATTCIESGVDIPTVSKWLGHKDGGALAMRVYGHLRNEHSREAAKSKLQGLTPSSQSRFGNLILWAPQTSSKLPKIFTREAPGRTPRFDRKQDQSQEVGVQFPLITSDSRPSLFA